MFRWMKWKQQKIPTKGQSLRKFDPLNVAFDSEKWSERRCELYTCIRLYSNSRKASKHDIIADDCNFHHPGSIREYSRK